MIGTAGTTEGGSTGGGTSADDRDPDNGVSSADTTPERTGDDSSSERADAETPRRPSNDDLYELLSDRRRRYALHYLLQRADADGGEAEPVPVGELAEQVAAWENGKTVEEITSQERKRVYIALYQSHLPRLDDEGLVEYDDDAGTVRVTESLTGVDLYLEVVPSESVPWSTYYAGLTLANGLVLLLAFLEVAPFDQVPGLGWAAVVLVSFGVSAFVQLSLSSQTQLGDEGPPPGGTNEPESDDTD